MSELSKSNEQGKQSARCLDLKNLPAEYKDLAASLFPRPTAVAVAAFAEELGVAQEMERWRKTSDLSRLLSDFNDNVALLIEKTWVEKNDEFRKDKLQRRIPGLIDLIKKRSYPEALKEFGAILDELSNLLFGAQSRKDDFIEYAMRLDASIGLFWWYGRQLGAYAELLSGGEESAAATTRDARTRPECQTLLIGLCFLSNF
jgi:hypothetical protein